MLTVVALFLDKSDPAARPLAEGLPTPIGLDWSQRTFDAVQHIGRMPEAGVLGSELALFAVLGYLLLRALNPTFRLTTGVDWDLRIFTRTYMHTAPLIKVFLIAISAFIPLVGVWWVIGAVAPQPGVAYVLQAAVAGAAAWLLFSREGVAGDCDNGNYLWPSERKTAWSLASRGALAGCIVGLCGRLAPFNPPDSLLAFHSLLGGIGEAQWWRIVGVVAGLSGLLGMAAAGACIALAEPALRPGARAAGVSVSAACCLALLWYGRVAIPANMRDRYDWNSGASPAVALARRVGAPLAPSGADTVLVFGGGRVDALPCELQSGTGLGLSPATRARIEAFLRTRDYRTTLSGPAFGALFDGAALDWDDAEFLRLALLRLEKCPDIVTMRLLLEKLATCAATPAAQHCAALLADPSRFRYHDNESRLLVGDLFARLGMRDLALRWYRLGGIAESRLADRYAARTASGDGVVTGRLLVDGGPARHVRVGLVRAQSGSDPRETLGANGSVSPSWMATVSPAAFTDDAGRFRLEHVVSGVYRVVARLPGSLPRGAHPRLRGADASAGVCSVGYGGGPASAGTLDVILRP